MLTDLSVTPFAETIRRLSADRKSGDLQVRSVKLVKTVFFDHGRIVFAASNLKKDRLGEALVALGRITDEDFQRVSALMKGESKKRFGDALVQSGVMDKNELGTSVARQVRRVALSFFEMPEGVAAFEERRCPIPLEYMVSLSIHKLLYDGIKTMTSPELILAGLGNLDRGVTIAPLPPFPFEGRRSAEEKEILELAQRRVTVRRLAWAAGMRCVRSSPWRREPSCSPRSRGSPIRRARTPSGRRWRTSSSGRPTWTRRAGSRWRAPPRATS